MSDNGDARAGRMMKKLTCATGVSLWQCSSAGNQIDRENALGERSESKGH